LGSLAESHGARCETMNYKTIRYPGHCAQMQFLMNDLKLNHDRKTLKQVLENAVPQTLQDVVIVYAAVTGTQDGELREENYVNKVYPQLISGRLWSAIQVTTAAGITAVVDLVLQQPKQYQGFVPQEKFSMPDILRNRFGRYFAQGGTKDLSAEVVVTGKAGRQRRLTSTATR
jgi:saccharopine dehydrogenase-like NADP-dependent oxidoreductase